MADDRDTMTLSADDIGTLKPASVNKDLQEKVPPEIAAIDDQLMALGEQKEAIRVEMRQLNDERDRLVAERSLQKKIADMSPAERKLLGVPEPQFVAPEGVTSEESHGTPGR